MFASNGDMTEPWLVPSSEIVSTFPYNTPDTNHCFISFNILRSDILCSTSFINFPWFTLSKKLFNVCVYYIIALVVTRFPYYFQCLFRTSFRSESIGTFSKVSFEYWLYCYLCTVSMIVTSFPASISLLPFLSVATRSFDSVQYCLLSA